MRTALEKLETNARRGKRTLWWIIPLLMILAILACQQLFSLASHFHNSELVILAGALLGLPALIILGFAFRQGLQHVRAFASTLKWWHLPWALTLVSALVFRIRAASQITAEPVDAWAGFRIGVDSLVAMILLARLALRRTNWVGSMLRGVVGCLTVFGLVSLASTTWSVFPPWTLYKSAEYLIDIALLAAILETIDSVEEYRTFFNWTWALYGLLLLSCWKDVLLWPREALYGDIIQMHATMTMRLNGVMPAVSANDIATFGAILGLVALARLFPASEERFPKSWYVLLLLGSQVTMVFAQTRSAFAGFLLGAFVILLYSKRQRLGAFVTLIVAPLAASTMMGGLIWSFLERGQTASQLDTLSGRAQWWSFAWQTFLERPLTGFGAYAAGRFAVLAKMGSGLTSTMHSDYLEIIVGTSLWGMIPFLVTLVATGWLLWRYVRDPYLEPQERQLAFEGLAIFAMLGLRSIFNDMFGIHPALPFLVILGYVEFLRRRRKAARQLVRARRVEQPLEDPDPQLELVFSHRS